MINLPMEATVTQECPEGQPWLEILQYENELLKEDMRVPREELERWREVRKNKEAQGLETLAEVAS